ncbi:hypothetical protein [Neorhizobium sp. JUb45]|uniref:hypothetical protein n=1 Tax=unclassified Neorhizobium TaxID=2629175 RepID=UPI0010521D8E|nr:hypothetical protein [Neorhizobium sp. JUb45]TCR06273.1 hypothetical protein EDF70_101226 [Neorhizobium sp. JUb45]
MTDKETLRQRTLQAAHLQAIEGNPLDAEQLAMFDMFDRESWSKERQQAYILERARTAGKKVIDVREAFYVHSLPDDILADLQGGYQGEPNTHLDELMK